MATATHSHSSSAPPPAAPELAEYEEQFAACDVPKNSGAIRAFKGFIRPFSDDQNAREVLRALDENLQLNVWGGRLFAQETQPKKHRLEDFLVSMALPLTVLVLEFPGKQHPRAFLLDPPMTPRFSMSPHLRIDKSVEIDGQMRPALCVYSGNLISYRNDRSRLAQFLDQTATYLAKYLVWLRTRQLYRRTHEGDDPVGKRAPHEPVTDGDVNQSRDLFWNGHWPGPSAPAGPFAHTTTIKPDDECWCWSGEHYGGCCRERELEELRKIRRDYAQAQLVPKLIAAVHRKLAAKSGS